MTANLRHKQSIGGQASPVDPTILYIGVQRGKSTNTTTLIYNGNVYFPTSVSRPRLLGFGCKLAGVAQSSHIYCESHQYLFLDPGHSLLHSAAVDGFKIIWPRNVAFLGASVDSSETQGNVSVYVQKLRITYPIWLGETDGEMKRLQIGDEVPATLYLDEKDISCVRILRQMRLGEIEERIDWLLRN
jgi:hypothetical protein